MGKTASSQRRASTQAYQLYVELEWVRPKVWRRFLVPITIELPLLHTTLLFGTGWHGGHIHEFVFGHDNYARNEPGLAGTSTGASGRRASPRPYLRGEHAGNGVFLPDGKARKPYEFGVKSAVVVSHKHGLMLGTRTFPGNPSTRN
jgi:hypothetical protein